MSCEKGKNIGVDISQVASARTPPNSIQCVSSQRACVAMHLGNGTDAFQNKDTFTISQQYSPWMDKIQGSFDHT